jgi:hypothetical protein
VVRRPAPAQDDEDFKPKDEDDDEEERPSRGVRSTTAKAKPNRPTAGPQAKPVRKGWGGARRVKEMSSDFADELKLESNEALLIKFLEDEPFAAFRQHWIEREGKRSWTCREDDCPLCFIGDRPQGKYCFNVLLLSDGEPVNKVWVTGSRIFSTLEGYSEDRKVGPLTKGYFSVKKTGKKGNAQVNVLPVKERDLPDDWGMDALDDDLLEKFAKQCWDDSAVQVHTRKQLRDIAGEISDEVPDADDEDDDE